MNHPFAPLFELLTSQRDISLSRFIRAACWLALSAALGLVTPYLLKLVIDRVVPRRDLSLLWIVIGVGMAAYALQSWSRYAGRWQASQLAEDFWYALRRRAFGHLQGLSLAYHRSSDIGDHVARAEYDTYSIKSLVEGGLPSSVEFIVTVVGTLAALLVLAPSLTLLGLLSCPALVLTAYIFRDKIRPLRKDVSRRRGDVYSAIHDGLAEAEAVKTYGLEDVFEARVHRASDQLRETNLEIARYQATLFPTVNFGVSLALLGVLGVGGHLVVSGSLTLGTLVAFFYYISKSLGPIRSIPGLVFNWYGAVAAAERLDTLFEVDRTIDRSETPTSIPSGPVEIAFEDVHFAYESPESDEPQVALDDFDLELPPESRVAILGPSGSGKSTTGKMIPRLFDPDTGDIRVAGTLLTRLDLEAWRARVGYVGQEVALFEGSIAHNIRLGAPERELDERQLQHVASIAGVTPIVEARDEGLETELGPDGDRLSGGERKRVALARALARAPDVLVLDQFAADLERDLCRDVMRAVRREFDMTILYLGHRVPEGLEPEQCLWMERGTVSSDAYPDGDDRT